MYNMERETNDEMRGYIVQQQKKLFVKSQRR